MLTTAEKRDLGAAGLAQGFHRLQATDRGEKRRKPYHVSSHVYDPIIADGDRGYSFQGGVGCLDTEVRSGRYAKAKEVYAGGGMLGAVLVDMTRERGLRDAGALPPRGLRTVVAFPLALDASWSAVRAAIAAKTQSLGGDLAEDHGALYARRRAIARDFEKIGPAWKRREGLVGTVKRADELWVKRTLTLSRGELAYFEKPTDWMVSTSARGRLSVTKDTSIVATENEDGAYFRGPAGAPTPHTLSVNDEWTFAFEDSRSLTAWRDALETAKTTPPTQPPPIFELRAAAATSKSVP